jgi:hypothetical protein
MTVRQNHIIALCIVAQQDCHMVVNRALLDDMTQLRKLVVFHIISDEDDIYIKVIALDDIYNFIVLSFFILDR